MSCCPDPFAIEHIYPLAHGGTDALDNLALSCFGCNGPKGDVTEALDAETNTIVPLFHPRQDDWHGHFAWNPTFTELIGKTPTGRATIQRLKLNRPGVVNLRRLMLGTEEGHPPSWTLPESYGQKA
jgi:HNH endonuclease